MATRRSSPGKSPEISGVSPAAAITGGELQIRGKSFSTGDRPRVRIGDISAPLIIGSDSFLICKVPEGSSAGELVVDNGLKSSAAYSCDIGIVIAENLHPVTNPGVDSLGNIYSTFSGSRGQKVPVAIFKLDLNFNIKPFVTDLMNPTAIVFDQNGVMYVSSRFDGIVYRVTPNGQMSVFVEGMGVATGLAFDGEGNLFVGDRSGTIFKINPEGRIFVFATLEASISAYHLAIGPDEHLYVTGPTTSSYDAVYRVNSAGEVETFFRGLGRPQGMDFDENGNLYVAGSIAGRKGVVRITPAGQGDLILSGPGIVGLQFLPSRALCIATTNALHRVDLNIKGWKFGR